MGTKTLDLDTATREQLIEKINNQRNNIVQLEESARRYVDRLVELSSKLDHWRKTLKKLIHPQY
jgi:septal ring factor EnvC (AmiA/AmiB activator)